MRGVTLLELLLVIGILTILAAAGIGLYYNVRLTVGLEEEERAIVSTLRLARSHAVLGERANEWGVRFDNTDAASPFYAVFEGREYASALTVSTSRMAQEIVFQTPPAGLALDVVFAQGAGTTTPTSVTIGLKNNPAQSKTISVSGQGIITR